MLIQCNRSDIQKAFTESFSRIDGLVDEQIMKAKQKHLNVKVRVMVAASQSRNRRSLLSGDHSRWRARVKSLSLPAPER